MVTITIDKKPIDFEYAKYAAYYIVEHYNGKKCPVCGKTIELDETKVYRKLRHRQDAFAEQVTCKDCGDGRATGQAEYFWYDLKEKQHSKIFNSQSEALNWFVKHPLYCLDCKKELNMPARFHHLARYKKGNKVYFTECCRCHECKSAKQIKDLNNDEAYREKMRPIRANNGRKGGKKVSEAILANPEERARRSERMSELNAKKTPEDFARQVKIMRKALAKWMKTPEAHEVLVKRAKNIHLQNKRARTQGLNRYKDLESIHLYFAEVSGVDDAYKIGITKDIEHRKEYFNSNFSSITSLLEADPVIVCNLEYIIKERCQIDNFSMGTEFIRKADLTTAKKIVKKYLSVLAEFNDNNKKAFNLFNKYLHS